MGLRLEEEEEEKVEMNKEFPFRAKGKNVSSYITLGDAAAQAYLLSYAILYYTKVNPPLIASGASVRTDRVGSTNRTFACKTTTTSHSTANPENSPQPQR